MRPPRLAELLLSCRPRVGRLHSSRRSRPPRGASLPQLASLQASTWWDKSRKAPASVTASVSDVVRKWNHLGCASVRDVSRIFSYTALGGFKGGRGQETMNLTSKSPFSNALINYRLLGHYRINNILCQYLLSISVKRWTSTESAKNCTHTVSQQIVPLKLVLLDLSVTHLVHHKHIIII